MDPLIDLGEPHRLVSSDPHRSSRFYQRAWIAGLQDRYLEIESPSHPWLMGIRFKPAGPLALLRVPLAELTNQVVDLDLILGPSLERLRQRLMEASLARASIPDPRAVSPGPHCFGESAARRGRLRAGPAGADARRGSACAACVGDRVSQKHLIDLFHEQVGMAPKRYARIVRLTALLKEMSSSNWADLAARFGYDDQPHFVREFREFSGTTPTEFLRARGPDGDSVVLDETSQP